MQSHDRGVKARIEQDLLVLRESIEISGVEGVDLLLGLPYVRPWLQPADVPPTVAVAFVVRLLLRSERQRTPQHHVVVDEREPSGHDADDGERLTVEADIAADGAGVSGEYAVP